MPSSPIDPSRVREANDPEGVFRRGLVEIDELIDSGVGLSGHERNCAFLNVPAGGSLRNFTTASAVTGVDFDDDARTPVVVDWDQDGDLDLWIANRSAPMLRFLQNNIKTPHHWLAVKLVGTTCNRDAIGARVVVILHGGRRLERVLRAGEGYLGQSSKWIHFGLGTRDEMESLKVVWPGENNVEVFTGTKSGQRWILTEGLGKATPDTQRSQVKITKRQPSPNKERESVVRAVTASRWTLPELPYTTFDGRQKTLGGNITGPTLLNLWATWCVPCEKELRELADARKKLQGAGVKVLALSVDGLDGNSASGGSDPARWYASNRLPFPTGRASSELVARLEDSYTALFGLRWPLPVPTSVLLDGRGRAVAFYKGAVSAEQVIRDAALAKESDVALHDASLPFSGRWFFRPQPFAPLRLPYDLMKKGRIEAARELALRTRDQLKKSPEYGKLLIWIGDTQMKQGKAKEAMEIYLIALETDPQNVTVLNNVAWQLATHKDASIRNGTEAVKCARRASELTKHQDPGVLDTLGAALAETGEFSEAIKVAAKALDLAREARNTPLAVGIESNLKLYRTKKPVRN